MNDTSDGRGPQVSEQAWLLQRPTKRTALLDYLGTATTDLLPINERDMLRVTRRRRPGDGLEERAR